VELGQHQVARGPQKWAYFYLYVILDVFSRNVVGWMVATEETAARAKELIAETCARQSITPAQLTLHADRGTSMTSKSVALLLESSGALDEDLHARFSGACLRCDGEMLQTLRIEP